MNVRMYGTVKKRTNLYVLRSTGNAYDVISHRRLSGPRAPPNILDKSTPMIFWTSESDEERTLPQNSIHRLSRPTCKQKEGKTKEKMDRHDHRGLQRTASNTSGFQHAGRMQVRRVWRAAIDERLTRAMASPGPSRERESQCFC